MARLHTAAADTAAAVVRGIGDSQLSLPTPCQEFNVADLVNHCFQVIEFYTEIADGADPELDTETDYLMGDWREGFAAVARECAGVFAALDADDVVGTQSVSPQDASSLVVSELVVHGWDLARATRQEFAPPPVLVRFLTEFHQQSGTPVVGEFGPAVDVAADAAPLDQLVGLLGRDPAWK